MTIKISNLAGFIKRLGRIIFKVNLFRFIRLL